MSKEAMLPCIICGKQLDNAFGSDINQPSDATEFRTYGHYGSTFWDSFSGEEIVINICDDDLRANTDKIARHKRYQNLVTQGFLVGRVWVEHELVPYFEDNNREPIDDIEIDPEEIGSDKLPGHIEWLPEDQLVNIRSILERS